MKQTSLRKEFAELANEVFPYMVDYLTDYFDYLENIVDKSQEVSREIIGEIYSLSHIKFYKTTKMMEQLNTSSEFFYDPVKDIDYICSLFDKQTQLLLSPLDQEYTDGKKYSYLNFLDDSFMKKIVANDLFKNRAKKLFSSNLFKDFVEMRDTLLKTQISEDTYFPLYFYSYIGLFLLAYFQKEVKQSIATN